MTLVDTQLCLAMLYLHVSDSYSVDADSIKTNYVFVL